MAECQQTGFVRARHATVALLIALVATWAAPSGAQPPVVRQTMPAAVRPGKTVELKFIGEQLAGATAAWSSVPATLKIVPPPQPATDAANSPIVEVSIPPDASPGVAALRIATERGVSNLCLILVDPLASVAEAGAHSTRETAQAIGLGVAVDGTCDAEASDWYRFTAAAGQTLQAEVFARRLGSALDPVLRLTDAAGRELAFSDDEPASGVDPWFRHTFATSGDYYLELRDIRFHGGPKHRYRLRLGDAADPRPSTAATADAASIHREQEPNNQPETATIVAAPGVWTGQLSEARDRDYFQFEAKQGQRLMLRSQTRSLGSPADLYLRLTNADGGVLAEVDDVGADDAEINFTSPADGSYRLMVEDVLRRGGADFFYRIVVEPYQPGFSLAVDGEKFDAPRSGVFVAKVTANRRDYNGPIQLSIDGVPDMLLSDNVIGEGQKETTLRATLPPSMLTGQLTPMRIFGQAKIGEVDFRVAAGNLATLRGEFAGLPFPPAALDGALALGVGPVFPEYFQLAVAEPAPPLPAAGGATKLKLSATRNSGFEDQISLELLGLPAGVMIKPAALEKKQESVELELTAAQPLAPGDYPIKIVGAAVFQNQPRRVVVESAMLRVAAAEPPSDEKPPEEKAGAAKPADASTPQSN